MRCTRSDRSSICNRLIRRHIIKYKEAFVKGKSVFIVMEHAPLGDVFERIDKCKQKGIHLKQVCLRHDCILTKWWGWNLYR